MKLPENYESWVEFAKECIEMQKKYPDAKTIIVNNSEVEGTVSEHNVNAVKAKAFDEVMEMVDFSVGEIYAFSGALNSDIVDILLKLAK